jgi:hypothetical protein
LRLPRIFLLPTSSFSATLHTLYGCACETPEKRRFDPVPQRWLRRGLWQVPFFVARGCRFFINKCRFFGIALGGRKLH